jgi:hypothetical protein
MTDESSGPNGQQGTASGGQPATMVAMAPLVAAATLTPVIASPQTGLVAATSQGGAPTDGDAAGNVLSLLPPQWRRFIYITYGLLALVGTAISAYYGALPTLTVPDWVTGGLAVLGALAAPISVLAATNVRTDKRSS